MAAASQSTSLRKWLSDLRAARCASCTGRVQPTHGGSTARSASLPSAMFDDGYVSPAYAEMENLHQQQYQLHEKLRAITETMRLIDSVNPSTITLESL